MNPTHRSVIGLLAWAALAGCTQVSEAEAPTANAVAPKRQLQGLQEPTFEIIPTADELVAGARTRIQGTVDEQVLAQVKAELKTFTYQPSNLIDPGENPGEPQGSSFMADAQAVTAQVEQLESGNMEVSCMAHPCMLRGDFDGDGQLDVAVQVVEKQGFKSGVALLMANSSREVLAAGKVGTLGDDLLWFNGWHVEPSSGGMTGAAASATSGATGAVLVIQGATRQGLVYFAKKTATDAAPSLGSAVIEGTQSE